MKPLFTIHAGEYLVGSHIEHHFRKWNVWLPSKDTGIDLLVSNARNNKTVSLQVKYSKDFNPGHRSLLLQTRLLAAGWWTHDSQKIKKSAADFWVFVLPSFMEHQTSFIIIPPRDLLRRLHKIHGSRRKSIQSYLRVTRTGRCWEARGLPNADQDLIALDRFSNRDRDFTQYLNGWNQIAKRLN